MVLPLLTWWLWPLIFAAMTVGYFGGAMGQERQPRDCLLMSTWGGTVALIMVSPFAYFSGVSALAYGAIGLLAGPIYWVNYRFGNGRFDWTQRAEFLTGVSLGAALFLAA